VCGEKGKICDVMLRSAQSRLERTVVAPLEHDNRSTKVLHVGDVASITRYQLDFFDFVLFSKGL
jgi:hypothetical protein